MASPHVRDADEQDSYMNLAEDLVIEDDQSSDDHTSLFHRLPAELRELIYHYLFPPSGLHLHIWRRPGSLKEPYCASTGTVFRAYPQGKETLSLDLHTAHNRIRYTHAECLVPHSDNYNYMSTKISTDEAVGRPVWNWLERERHGRCFDSAIRRPFPVQLVRSCRLIYSETAHLLYDGHVFYFHDSADLNDFALALHSRHGRAIAHVRLYCDTVKAESPLSQLTQEAATSMQDLKSLELTIGAAVHPWLQRIPRFGIQLCHVAVVIGPPYQKHLAGHSAHRNRPNAEEIEQWILSHRRECKLEDEVEEQCADSGPENWMTFETNPPLWPLGTTG